MIKIILAYLPALITVMIWGSTFLVSKNVLNSGIQSSTLMFFRFSIAYVLLLFLSKGNISFKFDLKSLRQELLFLLLGLSGGSLYFFLEYTSLKITSAVNVGLISATVPIMSTAISLMLGKIRVGYKYYVGSVFAFLGVVLIVLNGKWQITFSLFGDLLAILSSLLWAIYTVILTILEKKYSEVLISRRLFFYALLTIVGFVIFNADVSEFIALCEFSVLFSVLYLSLGASAICIVLWNISINKIGIVKTNNFLYLLPVVTLFCSVLFAIDEITIYSIFGSFLIFIGIYISDCK